MNCNFKLLTLNLELKMKILYHIPYPRGLGDDRTIYDGFKFAFEDLGHEVTPLTERDDLSMTLKSTRPDLFFTSLNIIDPEKNAPILKDYRQEGGVVLMKAGWIPKEETEISKLIKTDMLADIYTTELELPHFFELTGKQLKMFPLAASRQYHFPTKPVAKYKCDILYIGANLPKKRELFKRRLLPLRKKYDVRIYGTGWDAFDKYIFRPVSKIERKIFGTHTVADIRLSRQVPYEEENQAYSSAKICLNFHEQMSDGSFLLNGRTFKIPACGGFEICDHVPLVREYFTEEELVIADDDDDFFKKIDYYLAHDEQRKRIQKKGTSRTLKEHTYHNRVKSVLGWYNSVSSQSVEMGIAS